jgi:hypothetical protein
MMTIEEAALLRCGSLVQNSSPPGPRDPSIVHPALATQAVG